MKKRLSGLFHNRKFTYGSVVAFHVMLICIIFHRHITHPLTTMLFTRWDGLKNNFTLVSYVKENTGAGGLYRYHSFNYPFGDYVYSTDNTPLFSIPFKWFCHHVYDISDYALPLFNFCILANIVLCGILVFYVFKRLLHNNIIAWLAALVLPWTNFQILRLFAGHFNLTLTSLFLIAIALFMGWHRNAGHVKKQVLYGAWMCLLCCCSFLIHGYYLAIFPAFLSAMLFFSGLMKWRTAAGIRSMIAAVVVPVICAILCLGLIYTTDGYFGIRQDIANGYDGMNQKTVVSLLFSPYNFITLGFPLQPKIFPDEIEHMLYLGNIGLYAALIIFLLCVFNRKFRLRVWRIQKDFFRNPLLAGIALAGLLMLSMSLGEKYYHIMTPAHIVSPLNHFSDWPLWEIVFAVLMISVSAYVLIRAIMMRPQTASLPELQESRKTILLKSAAFYILSAVVLYLLFGGYTLGHGLVKNFTNPLAYLHKFTRKVEQFRSLSRFAWPFYWTFYIWILYTVARIYKEMNTYAKTFILLFIVFLGIQDTADYGREMERSLNGPTLFSAEEIHTIKTLKIDFSAYQAILPIPYYQVGSEDYAFTINDIEPWDGYTYNLSLASGLPLMSSKLARTPPLFAQTLMRFVSVDSITPLLAQHLNTKPILVAVNRKFLSDSTLFAVPNKQSYPTAYEMYWQANQFVERHQLQPFDSLGEVYFYKWQPPSK